MHGGQRFQIVHGKFAHQETTGLADEAGRLHKEGRFHKKEIIKLALAILDKLAPLDG
jgi:hypothetical protein